MTDSPHDPNAETRQHEPWLPPGAPQYGPEPQTQHAEPWEAPEPASKAQRSGVWRWLAVAAVSALIGGAVATAVDDGGSTKTDATKLGVVKPGDAQTAPATPSTIRGVLEKVQPAVVTIETTGVNGQGTGTGMLITSDGEILTNNHVVSGARTIKVTLDGEKQSRKARVLGADASIDSALVKIDDASNLPTIEFGSSSSLQVGDEVVAIGNAAALPGGPSVTSGIVSAKDRNLPDTPEQTLNNLIQTDTAINPGNSGGPLANMAGQVVGMNTVVLRGNTGEFQNIGFALSIDNVRQAIDDLRAGRGSSIAYLGVSAVTLTDNIRTRYQLEPQKGAVVDTVQTDSPADAAGLSRFDVITAFDAKPVDSNETLVQLVRAKRPGDKVAIEIYRGTEKREVSATLAVRPVE